MNEISEEIISATGTVASVGSAAGPGEISWILICSALVFIMVPGVALFYGGMLRKQSMTSIMTQTLAAMGVMTVSWFLVGYSLSFSGDGILIGSFDSILLHGVSEEAVDGISEMEFAIFQMMFSMITAAIVIGACAERIRYSAMIWFLVIWSVVVYAPMAHWVWGGGLIDRFLTVLDFAGGTVVHICAGATGLALIAFLGSRSDHVKASRAHNVPFAFIGGILLWFGWFGFNGGSGLSADGVSVHAIMTTQISAAGGLLSWSLAQYMKVGRVGTLGMITGAVAGLVAITPGAPYIGYGESLLVGIAGGVICFFAVRLFRAKVPLDDALDVFAVHGTGGIWGAIATGIFADPALSGGIRGLAFGGTDLFVGQIAAVLITLAFCFTVSYAIIWVLSKLMRVKLTPEEEMIGQDLAEHAEPAYMM